MFNYPCILQCLYILVGYYDFKELIVLVKGRLQCMVEQELHHNFNFFIITHNLQSLHLYYTMNQKREIFITYGYGKNKKICPW